MATSRAPITAWLFFVCACDFLHLHQKWFTTDMQKGEVNLILFLTSQNTWASLSNDYDHILDISGQDRQTLYIKFVD